MNIKITAKTKARPIAKPRIKLGISSSGSIKFQQLLYVEVNSMRLGIVPGALHVDEFGAVAGNAPYLRVGGTANDLAELQDPET